MRNSVVLVVSALTALAAPFPATADLAGQLAGKTLAAAGGSFEIGTDGSLSGKTAKGETVKGTWAVRDGKWCRKITAPKRLAGEECQSAVVKGKVLTLTRKDGSTVKFDIR